MSRDLTSLTRTVALPSSVAAAFCLALGLSSRPWHWNRHPAPALRPPRADRCATLAGLKLDQVAIESAAIQRHARRCPVQIFPT